MSIIVKDMEGKVLLGAQKRKGFGRNKYQYLLTFPRGKVDFVKDKNGNKVKEDNLISVARELWEETRTRLNLGELDHKIKSPKDLTKFNQDEKLLSILGKQLIFKGAINDNRNIIYEVTFDSKIHTAVKPKEAQSDILIAPKFVSPNFIDNNLLNENCLNKNFFATGRNRKLPSNYKHK